jgi:hypothetical protein
MRNEDLAVPELATVEIKGFTRGAFILKGAMAAGAMYGAGAVSPFVGRALAQGGDVDIVNFALTLEYLEAAFYTEAVKNTKGLSGDVAKLAKELRDNEMLHVDALTATVKKLGGTPAKKPGVDFGGAFAGVDSFLKTANVFEDTGVSAYNGAAPMIQSTEVLAAAGSIVQVEARHASLIRLQRSKAPAPQAFDKPSDKNAVLMAVQPFIKS